ncbi:MAG: hypothetical protein ABJ251_23490 [Paracoccaceae bacterium]
MLEFLQNYPEVTNGIGVVGFVVYIGSFSLVQAGHICGNGMAYALTNVVAASLVLLSLINAFNIASFLIQISFITIGLYGAGRKLCGQQNEPDAEKLYESGSPTVTGNQALAPK